MNRQYRLGQTLLNEGMMEHSEQLNRVAFALTRFALASGTTDTAGTARWAAGSTHDEQVKLARSLASHAAIALGSDLRIVADILEDDPLLLSRRLRESRDEFTKATERLVEAYNGLLRTDTDAERLTAMSMFRREAANFAPVVENRSRVLMQLEATIEGQLRANQSSFIRYLNRLVSFELAGTVLLILLVVLVLRSELSRVRTLTGLIPICSHCKKVRNDKGYWNQVEEYVSAHSEADFSHSLCPECLRDLYPDIAAELDEADSAHQLSSQTDQRPQRGSGSTEQSASKK